MKVNDIADSRGNPTIEIELENKKGNIFFAKIPSGKSKGEKEAATLPLKEAREAADNVFARNLRHKDFSSIQEVDCALQEFDSSPNKEVLGGNVALGISLAAARAIAFERNQELWEALREEFFAKEQGVEFPLVFSNLINGGAHGKNNLNIQEYMVVVSSNPSPQETKENLIAFYEELGEELKENGDLELGDEGGYSRNFKNNREPLEILTKCIPGEYSLALDAAASTLQRGEKYFFEGKELSPQELFGIYKEYFSAFPSLFSLEDAFCEDDAASFQSLLKEFPEKWIVGDDITATNASRIAELAKIGAMNAVIIKPNQIGTVTETCEAMETAKRYNIKRIVSHRSGTTDDHFLVSFARAANAEGVKIGAPARERLGKFNEFVRLYGSA